MSLALRSTMICRVSACSLALSLSLAATQVAGDPAEEVKRTRIHNVKIFDGTSDSLRDGELLIEGDLIKVVSKRIDTEVDKTIDGGGNVLIPGLIDSHHHAFMAGLDDETLLTRDASYVFAVAAANAARTLMYGFTTVRDLAGPTFGLKEAIDKERDPDKPTGVIGPRIYPSGAMISQTSGHGDFANRWQKSRRYGGVPSRAEELGVSMTADGVGEVLTAVRENLRLGASQIKLAAGGGAASAYDPLDVNQFTTEELEAAVKAATDWGTYVAVHIYQSEGIRRAVEAGVKCIDHGQLMDRETLTWLVDNEVWLSMQPFVDEPGQSAKRRTVNKGTDQVYTWIKELQDLAAGKPAQKAPLIVFGTDRLRGQGANMTKDLVNLGTWFEPVEVLRQATGRAGRLLGLCDSEGVCHNRRDPYPHKLGVIEPGAYADLLVVKGNPLEDLTLLGNPENNLLLIMKGGAIYRNRLHRSSIAPLGSAGHQ